MATPDNKLKKTQYHQYPPIEVAGDEFTEIQFSDFEGYILGSDSNPVVATSISVDLEYAIPGTEALMFHSAATKPTFTAGDTVNIVREVGSYSPSVVNPISILYVGGNNILIAYMNEGSVSEVNYSTLQGEIGWAKVATLTPDLGEFLEYSLIIDLSYISDAEQFFYGNAVFYVEYLGDGSINYNLARVNGNVNPEDFILVDTGSIELYFRHLTIVSELRFKKVIARTDDYFELHDKLAIVVDLPAGDQYLFEQVSDVVYEDINDIEGLRVVGGTSGEYTITSLLRRVKKESIMFFEIIVNFGTTGSTPTGDFYIEIPDIVGIGADETNLISATFNRIYDIAFLNREKQIDVTVGSRLIFRNDDDTIVQCAAIDSGAVLTIKGFAKTSL